MDKYVLIVAGGKGLRMGGDLPKQFIPMRGKPLLMHTLEAFHRWDASARIILVLPEDHQPYWNMLCKEIGCKVPHAIVKGVLPIHRHRMSYTVQLQPPAPIFRFSLVSHSNRYCTACIRFPLPSHKGYG